MNHLVLFLAFAILSSVLHSQTTLGYVKDKNTTLFYAGGRNAFLCRYKNGFEMNCVDTENRLLTEAEIDRPAGKHLSSWTVMGTNRFYNINEVSKTVNATMFTDLVVLSWDGKTTPVKYEFPGRYNGTLRCAIANDEDLYLLIDRETTGFSEAEVYRARHALLRLNFTSGMLHELPVALAMNYNEPQCSFWAPLRIGADFTEWYRTKTVNKKFTYEITRLDLAGKVVWTRTITSDALNGSPDLTPELSDRSTNVLNVNSALFMTDTATKITRYSLLTYAPLAYDPLTGLYFSVAHVSEFRKEYTRGIYVLVLNNDLSVLSSQNYPDLVQGGKTAKAPKSFVTVDVNAALRHDSTVFVNIVYKKLNNKMVDQHFYELRGTTATKFALSYSFSRLGGYYYPGAEAEQKTRSMLSAVPVDDRDKAAFVCTRNGVLYYAPSGDKPNVFWCGYQ